MGKDGLRLPTFVLRLVLPWQYGGKWIKHGMQKSISHSRCVVCEFRPSSRRACVRSAGNEMLLVLGSSGGHGALQHARNREGGEGNPFKLLPARLPDYPRKEGVRPSNGRPQLQCFDYLIPPIARLSQMPSS